MDIDKRDRTELKAYFVKNAIPTESNFAELIDATLNQKDDGVVKSPGSPLALEGSGDATSQRKVLNFYEAFSDAEPTWVFSLNPRARADDPATANTGFSISDGKGRSRLFIDKETGKIGVGTTAAADALTVAGGLRILSGSNPIRFTSKWSDFSNNSTKRTNNAEISNDTTRFKTLMIVGNRSAGGKRRVSVWDRLEVNGTLKVTGDTAFGGVVHSAAGGFKFPDGSVQTKAASDSKDLTVNGVLSFGATTRQMVNLWRTIYGIGVQSNTQYFRTDKNFAWYKGGSHNNSEFNPGGGTALMKMDGDGNLTVLREVRAQVLTVNGVVHSTAGGFKFPDGSVQTKAATDSKDLTVNGVLSFGATTRQMVNLYEARYGIGVQSGTQYFRSHRNFAWYKGGSHNNSELNPGGGTALMTMGADGNLTVNGNLYVEDYVKVRGKKPIVVKRYENLGDNVHKKTDYSSSEWVAAIVGFAARHADIYEGGRQDIIKVFMYEDSGYWYIRADFVTEKDERENWYVDVMFISRGIASRSGNTNKFA